MAAMFATMQANMEAMHLQLDNANYYGYGGRGRGRGGRGRGGRNMYGKAPGRNQGRVDSFLPPIAEVVVTAPRMATVHTM